MGTRLRLLLAEDSEDDAMLVLRELWREGFDLDYIVVDDADELRSALRDQEWDCVISDYHFPDFNGMTALRIVQDSGEDLPFIVVSGAIEEETALSAMRAGAGDFVMKDNLARLGPVVRRELVQAEGRRARRRALEGYRILVEKSLQGLFIAQDDAVVYANPAIAEIVGFEPAELVAMLPEELISMVHRDDRDELLARCADFMAERPAPSRYEVRIKRRDGRARWLEMFMSRIDFEGRPAIQAAVIDITERRQREREREAIVTLATALRAAKSRTEIPPVILAKVLDLLQADGAALATRDPVESGIVFEAANGVWSDVVTGRIGDGEGLTGLVFATGEPFVSTDASTERRLVRPDILTSTGVIAGTPLIAEDRVIGVLWVGRESPFEMDDVRVLTAIAEMSASALRRVTLHEETRLRLKRLHALRSVDLAITTTRNLDAIFDVVLDELASQLEVDAACVLRYRPSTGTLVTSAHRGLRNGALSAPASRLGEGLAGRVAAEQRMLEVSDVAEAGNPSERDTVLAKAGFVAYCGVPLVAKGALRGVLEVLYRRPMRHDEERLGFLQTVAWQVATAVDGAILVDELQRSNLELGEAYESTLEGWARALELRDQETEGHTRRVTGLTVRIAEALGIGGEEQVQIRRGAMLHDIGKMAIPDAILLKPGPLDEDEWEIMRRHPQYAREMLWPLEHLRPAIEIPFSHHERWDGSGYPRGLKGEEIPVEARIFAVVDVWDALLSDRPYRTAWSRQRAVAYLREESGRLFDPSVVEAFLTIMGEQGNPRQPGEQPSGELKNEAVVASG